MGYGKLELRYAEPFANALASDATFRSWVLRKTKFAVFANEARLLHREMKDLRSAKAKYWWRSHYSETCRCSGCSGQETDLLAIFELKARMRFALHFEVKHPGDRFKDGGHQAAAYKIRAACWSTLGGTPANILSHSAATTVLLCSETKLTKYAAHLRHFETLITFEDVANNFPHASAG